MFPCIQTGPPGPSPCVHTLDVSIHFSQICGKCWQTPHHESEASPALSTHLARVRSSSSCSSPPHVPPWLWVPLPFFLVGSSGIPSIHTPLTIPGRLQVFPSSQRAPDTCLHPHAFQTSAHALGVQKLAGLSQHALRVPHPLPHTRSPNHAIMEVGKDI